LENKISESVSELKDIESPGLLAPATHPKIEKKKIRGSFSYPSTLQNDGNLQVNDLADKYISKNHRRSQTYHFLFKDKLPIDHSKSRKSK
jgi:hypothetical protein